MSVQRPTSRMRDGIARTEGPSARSVSRPTSPAQIADLLQTASDLGHGVVPYGGGLNLATGNVTEPVDIGLDLTGLSGVHSYHPADLTLSVGAGTTFAEIDETLQRHGQELPIDVPFPERATIGGLIATGFAGPRRLSSGSLKDLLIGCEFVRGDGLLAKAGGMVVKNVSGFEIPRLLHGSWGSLAVLTSVNLKVVPAPRSEATLVLVVDTLASGLEWASVMLAKQPAMSACTVSRTSDGTTVAVRCMGREGAVGAMIAELKITAARSMKNADALDMAESRSFWRSQVEAWARASSEVVVTIGTRPRNLSMVATMVENHFETSDRSLDLIASPGTGSIRFRFGPTATTADELRAWWRGADLPGPTVGYIEFAPPDWKGGANVWGLGAEPDPLMRAIKTQFDPRGILNPGRLFI